jgi:Spy/CpxP family protein refolding chaperone
MHDMNLTRKTIAAALLAACCATTFAAGQLEAPPADGGQDAAQGREGRGPGPGPEAQGRGPGGPGFGHEGGHEFGPGFGHHGGLRLTEAQQDKLFAIRHAAAPQHRQQEKAVRRAHEALRALGDAAPFDDARANAASRELGQAIAAQALLRARVHAQMLAVLTPEQREQMRKRRPQPPQERP